MTIEDYIYLINKKRKTVNAIPIEIFRRPGSKNPHKETIVVRSIFDVTNPNVQHEYFKSQNWGNINIFLRGMLTGFVNEVLPMPSSKPMDEATHRRLEL
jgi:hypothetical protein